MPLVYHVLSDKSVGGAEKVVLSLAKHSAQSRFRSHVLLPEKSMLIPLLKKARISYTEYKEAKASFSLFRFFFRFLKKHPCDFLVSHGLGIARAAGRCAGISHLISFKHCALPIAHPILYRFFTDATVSVSENANLYLQNIKIPSKKRMVLPNGFHAVGVPNALTRAQARASLGIPENSIAIGISARLAPVKGHRTALHALALLPSYFSLYLLGDGEERQHLAALAHTLGIEKRVHFLGFKQETKDFYHAMDAHLSCSLDSETASLALAEGMSAGCPTFATSIAGNLARVKEGGAFFSPGSEKELAILLSRLNDASYRQKMRCAALKRAEELPGEEAARGCFEAFLSSFYA